jgi:hypothetical protein
MSDNLLIVFIAVTAVAVVIQAGILVAFFFVVRKTAAQVEALSSEVQSRALPAAENVLSMMVELRPKIEALTTDVSESSNLVRNQLARIDATLTDAIDRARLQVIRADELLNRTMDKVEETSEVVQKTVISPLQKVNGLMAAISTGVEVFLGQKRRQPRNGAGVPQDEMFI